jgi:hypothetical protein
MLYFIDDQAKLGAAEGHKDDRVMAASVAMKVISITPNLKKPETKLSYFEEEAIGTYADRSFVSRDKILRRYM